MCEYVNILSANLTLIESHKCYRKCMVCFAFVINWPGYQCELFYKALFPLFRIADANTKMVL